MTLILSCGTPDFVFQVLDRRLTYVDGPNAGTPSSEEANKAVVVGHRMAFGYTGPQESERNAPMCGSPELRPMDQVLF